MFNIQALSVFLLATLAVATPTVPTYHYNPAIKTTPFTDKTCKLSKTVAPGAAFTNSYPVANSLGGQVSRALRMDIGVSFQKPSNLHNVSTCILILYF